MTKSPSPIFLTVILDDESEAQIIRLQNKLEDAGLPVAYDNPNLPGRVRPHLSVAAYDVAEPGDWDGPLQNLLGQRRPFPMHLHSLGLFVEPGVVFLALRMSRDLLELHDSIQTLFDGHGLKPRSPNFLRGQFNPHCTLLPKSSGQQTLRAIEICRENWQPVSAMAVGVGMLAAPELIDRRQYRFVG